MMNPDVLNRLKECPYCRIDHGVCSVEFEVAFQDWQFYDAEERVLKVHHSKDREVIVFCVTCGNELLEEAL